MYKCLISANSFDGLQEKFNVARNRFESGNFSEAQLMMGKLIEEYSLLNLSVYTQKTLLFNETPKRISVVIVSHFNNGNAWKAARSVASRMDGRHNEVEFVLIGNGCEIDELTDQEPAAFAYNHRLITLPLNFLPSLARNIGSLAASGDWLYFLDDDAEFLTDPDKLFEIISSSTHAVRGRLVSSNHGTLPDHYDLGATVIQASLNTEGNCLIRKTLFSLLGGFDPLLFGHEGHDLSNRMLTLIPNYTLIYHPLLVAEHHPSTGAKKAVKADRTYKSGRYLQYKRSCTLSVASCLYVLIDPSQSDVASCEGWASKFAEDLRLDLAVISEAAIQLIPLVSIVDPRYRLTILHNEKGLGESFAEYQFFIFSCAFSPINSHIIVAEVSNLLSTGSVSTEREHLTISLNPNRCGHRNQNFESWFIEQCARRRSKSSAPKPPTILPLLVISFHTPDAYYSEFAASMKRQLLELNIPYDIRQIEIPEGLKWPAICRKKVQFYYELFRDNFERYQKIIWIDIDCQLHYIPSFVFDFKVDLMAFRRGFQRLTRPSKPKTRFWEPCLFVFDCNKRCLDLLEKASELEKRSPELEATDDFFFEEAWREVGSKLSYFEIPGDMAYVKEQATFNTVEYRSKNIFFSFGSSGNVQEFRGSVVQHDLRQDCKSYLGSAKRIADNQLKLALDLNHSDPLILDQPEHTLYAGLDENHRHVAKSLAAYAVGFNPIKLFWWIRPAPGNMGDWLSPYILSRLTGRAVHYAPAKSASIVSLGSVGKFVQGHHVVWGTGISEESTQMDSRARYLAVRGPYTRAAVLRGGGVCGEIFGDPGILMSRLYSARAKMEKGRFGFVRHFVHQNCSVQVGTDVTELNILMSNPVEIEEFIDALNRCEAVATTSLHVCILCNSYKIPCVLVSLDSEVRGVHGDGVKYKDFFLGAGLRVQSHVRTSRIDSSFIRTHAVADFASDEHKISLHNSLYKFSENMLV